MAAIIIEEVNRLGHVVNRHKVEHFPVTIGRSFDNDIILDDPYISPAHITITQIEDEEILFNDSSLNGVLCRGKVTREDSLTVPSGEEIVIGRTRLRFYSTNHAIPETRPIKHSIGLAKKLTHPVMLILFILIFSAMLSINIILSAKQELSFEKGLTEFLFPIIFVVFWSGIWAFVGRIIKHQPQFWIHVVIVLLFLIASNIFGWAIEILEFNLVSETFIKVFEMGLFMSLVVWLVMNHLRYSTSLLKMTRMLGATIFATSIASLYVLNNLAVDQGVLISPPYNTTIKAPYAKLKEDVSIETYLGEANAIFEISIKKVRMTELETVK